ncbi:glycoside hydrolase family 26 protein [Bacteroidota bacterium]
MKKIVFGLIFLALLFGQACRTNTGESAKQEVVTVDANATVETKALMYNLLHYQDDAIMFGHQDDLAYGIGWWAEEFQSDVQLVSGKFPAVFGWDAGEIGQERNIDSVLFSDMQKWMIEVFERGGINTLSWHLDNPVTKGDSWDKTPAVYAIIPGGELHEEFKSTLDDLAAFLEGLKTKEGIYAPVIFRPWHEHTGDWFWWGTGNCSTEEYKALCRFTVEYLRDVKGLHHLLYAYSTDIFDSEEEYLERYPGDDYIDMLGYDDYHQFKTEASIPDAIHSLQFIAGLAGEKNKPFALTETGLERIPDPYWFTEKVLNSIKADKLARKASYLLVWRNARLDHHYVPYPGHPAEEEFRKFEQDPFTWFLEDLPDFYELEE